MSQQTRIVMIEGMPFTGKSTTSEYITTQLKLNGLEARWVSEGILFQRYFPQTLVMMDQQQAFSAAAVRSEWSAFVESALAAPEILVVDSALSYVGAGPFMAENWPLAAIQAEFRQIAELIAPLHPRVIHLTGDMERLVPASIAERGAGWAEQLVRQGDATAYQKARGWTGVAGAAKMFHDAQELMRALLAQGSLPALTLDIAAQDWPATRRAILDFLELAEVQIERPEIARSVLESYAGTYATDDPERTNKVFLVRLEDETLILHTPTDRYGPLLPVTPTRFHLQASPVDIEFAESEGPPPHLTVHTFDGKAYIYQRE